MCLPDDVTVSVCMEKLAESKDRLSGWGTLYYREITALLAGAIRVPEVSRASRTLTTTATARLEAEEMSLELSSWWGVILPSSVAGLAVLVIAAALFCFYKRWRRRRDAQLYRRFGSQEAVREPADSAAAASAGDSSESISAQSQQQHALAEEIQEQQRSFEVAAEALQNHIEAAGALNKP